VKAHSISYVAADAIRRLVAYDWPGNIRQLENVVMRAVIMSTDVNLMIDLPEEQHVQPGVSHSNDRSLIPANAEMNEDLDIATLDDVERRHIMNVLQKCSWKIKGPRRAADCLGMAPSTLRYRMRKLGIKRPSVAKPR
jgi:DNA-binding NtrC family response regulator